jgi:hypothetical protein
MRTKLRPISLVAAALLGAWACQGLDITNTNNPDRDRASRDIASIEGFVAGSFSSWWEWVHDDSPVWVMSTAADEFSAAFFDFGILDNSREPRPAWNNSSIYDERFASQDPWYGLYSMISTVNDALLAFDRGLRIVQGGADLTARADAVGKFMQGLGHGHLALYFDQAYIVDETVALDTVLAYPLAPHPEVMDSAISYLEQSIAIATANTFTLPSSSWLRVNMDNQGLARLAHSWIARLLASEARTRAERATVDWNLVIQHADQGITTDFAPIAVAGIFVDDFKRVVARQRTTSGRLIPSDFARVDNWLVGPSDSSDAFINWVNAPLAQRTQFRLFTRDRRIQPATATPTDTLNNAKYFGYTNTNRFDPSRGTYHQSSYHYRRFGLSGSWQTGPQLAMSVTEMNLLKAEALMWLNRAAEAVPLINLSRVVNGELPPVTVDGPPDEPGCVPRKIMPGPMQGQCGSLWDALRYEKRLEMAGVDPTVAFYDARGWQSLVQNTFVQWPVPGRELITIGAPTYTFGGGGPSSAPAPDPERCPVVLPRCP